MSANLTVEISNKLSSVTADEWDALFESPPELYDALQVVEKNGFREIELGSLVVRQGSRPILYLPYFITEYSLVEAVEVQYRKYLRWLLLLAPTVFRPKLIGIGIVESDWGAIGYDRTVDHVVLNHGWDLALQALECLRRSFNAKITAFVDFNEIGGAALVLSKLKGFSKLPGRACAFLDLNFCSMDEYFSRFSKSSRKGLRRKSKSSSQVRIEKTTGLGAYSETAYSYYVDTFERSDMKLGMHCPAYFDQFCECVPGSFYLLYFLGEKLIGFNLLVQRGGTLFDKYFCMHQKLGREYDLYFVSWLENIKYCLKNRLHIYQAGPSAEATKVRLGARLARSETLFRHSNSALNIILRLIANFLNRSAADGPKLGRIWSAPDGAGSNPCEVPTNTSAQETC